MDDGLKQFKTLCSKYANAIKHYGNNKNLKIQFKKYRRLCKKNMRKFDIEIYNNIQEYIDKMDRTYFDKKIFKIIKIKKL